MLKSDTLECFSISESRNLLDTIYALKNERDKIDSVEKTESLIIENLFSRLNVSDTIEKDERKIISIQSGLIARKDFQVDKLGQQIQKEQRKNSRLSFILKIVSLSAAAEATYIYFRR